MIYVGAVLVGLGVGSAVFFGVGALQMSTTGRLSLHDLVPSFIGLAAVVLGTIIMIAAVLK